jgi:hypothetical protein
LPREEWTAFIPDAHEGYISWAEFEENVQKLRDNAQALGLERDKSPPREGPALLQGLVICGKCGERMTVRYHDHRGQRVPDYVCQRRGIQRSEAACQQVHGAGIDDAIGKLLVETVSPVTLEVALTVQRELESRSVEVERLRQREVEAARYEAELARRRFMQVDPDHRMVADTLEAEWNVKLRSLAETTERCEQRHEVQRELDEEQRRQILALASDFPRLWNDPRTHDRERKRMARLLIEDVTLLRADDVTVHVRFKGGATRTLSVPLPKPSWELRKTPSKIVVMIDQLLDEHTDAAIAKLLNGRGLRSGHGRAFKPTIIARIRKSYELESRYLRLRARGLLEECEIAECLDVTRGTIKIWRRAGLLVAYACNDKGHYLFERPGPGAPVKNKHQGKLCGRRRFVATVTPSNE